MLRAHLIPYNNHLFGENAVSKTKLIVVFNQSSGFSLLMIQGLLLVAIQRTFVIRADICATFGVK